MSLIATAVKHLMAAGVTGEALLAAIAEMEAEVRAEPKARSTAAIRQERYRRNKASRVTESDVCDAPSLSRPLSPQTPHTPTHTHPDNNTRARKVSGLDRPTDVSEPVWRDALAHRKALKKPLTETALVGIRREADRAGWPIEAALVEMVSRGWQGFKADWVESQPKPGAVPVVSANPVEAAEKAAALYRRMGRDDDAREAEKRAERLRSGSGPPRSIGQIVGGLNAPPP